MRKRMIESILTTATIHNISEFKNAQYMRFMGKMDMFIDACREPIGFELDYNGLIKIIKTKSESYKYNYDCKEFEKENINEI